MSRAGFSHEPVLQGGLLFLTLRFAVFLLIALSVSLPFFAERPLVQWGVLSYFAFSEILLLLRSNRWTRRKIAIGIYFLDVYAVTSLILTQGLSVVWYLTIPVFMLGVNLLYKGRRSWLLISLIPAVLILLQLFRQGGLTTGVIWEYGGVVFLFFVFEGTVHALVGRLEYLNALCRGQQKVVRCIIDDDSSVSLKEGMQKILEKEVPFGVDLQVFLFRDPAGDLRGLERRREGEVSEVWIHHAGLPYWLEKVPVRGRYLEKLQRDDPGDDFRSARDVQSLLILPMQVEAREGFLLFGRRSPSAFSTLERENLLLYGEMIRRRLVRSDVQNIPSCMDGEGREPRFSAASPPGEKDEREEELRERLARLKQENARLQSVIDNELHSETLELKKAALAVLSRESEQDRKVLEKLASAELSQAVSHLFDMHLVLDLILEVICKKLKVENASIMLLREESRDLIISAHRGLKDEVVRETRLMVGEAIAGYVAQKGEPLLIEDVRKDPRFVPFSRERYRSGTLLSVPILGKEKVLGVINLSDPAQDGPFREQDLEILQAMSRQAAIVIENDRMYQEFKNGRWIREIYEEELSQRVSKKVFQEGQVLEKVAGEYPVTILSVHLHEAGSSAAVDSLERIRLIEQCFQDCRRILVRRRGDVAGETGAGMIGLFGLPFPDAKDAWQSVLAAVDLLKYFAGKSSKTGTVREEGFGVSIGISTGRVLLREKQGTVPYAVFGETWERAVTLMHAASPGQILVDEPTHDRIEDAVNALRLVLPYGINKQLTAFGIKGLKKVVVAAESVEM
ncbi:MAG: GAF domain-containing protein [Deltaproteobacteria bacterium]|nr:GAF domain-containing protein [Deltaproteobacteria bacterium]